MARSKRRTRWFDNIDSTLFTVVGAAAPGTIVNRISLGEAAIEDNFNGGTLVRTVGTIWLHQTAGSPIMSVVLYMSPTFAGSVEPTDWVDDTFERQGVMMTWFANPTSISRGLNPIHVDVRSKRKLMPGVNLNIVFQNHAIATNDCNVSFHLRHLILLP